MKVIVVSAHIGGLEIPSTDPLFLSVLAVHVAGGLTCVVTGAGAAIAGKGRPRHIRFGRVYVWSVGVVFGTALVLAALRWPHDIHLAVLGAISFAAAFVGYLARRRHWPGDRAHIVGMGTSYVALLTAFYVDNGRQLPLWDRLPTAAYWLLPALVGAPIVLRALARHRAPPSAAEPR